MSTYLRAKRLEILDTINNIGKKRKEPFPIFEVDKNFIESKFGKNIKHQGIIVKTKKPYKNTIKFLKKSKKVCVA